MVLKAVLRVHSHPATEIEVAEVEVIVAREGKEAVEGKQEKQQRK